MNFSEKYYKLNPIDKNLDTLHFYHYLENGGYKDNSTDCKLGYLIDTFNFKKGSDTISYDVIKSLNYVIDYYFNANIAPVIRKKRKLELELLSK